jgi:type II secretory pathway pseudopilin PulG
LIIKDTMKKLFKEKNKHQRGFTLIELVLYAGLLSILVGVMGTIFAQIVDVQLDSEATSSVDQDGRYIMSKMLYDMKALNTGDIVVTPANPGDTTTTLQLRINSINYTYSLDSNGNLLLTNGSTGETNMLNSYNASVTGLSFQRIGSGGSNDTIRVNFTIQSRVEQNTGNESRSFQTTLARQ